MLLQTVFFVPAKSSYIFSKFNPLNNAANEHSFLAQSTDSHRTSTSLSGYLKRPEGPKLHFCYCRPPFLIPSLLVTTRVEISACKPLVNYKLDPENVRNASKGWFPLSRNFQVPTQVNVTRVNKIEAMYGTSRVNVKVEPRSSLNVYVRPFIHGIAFILFTHLKFALRKKHATVEIHLKTPVDSQTKSWYTLFFSLFPLR